MTTIATLAVKLIADAAGFLATMDQAEKKSQTWSQNVSRNLKDVGGNMTRFGGIATAGLTMPIVGAGLAAIKLASDYEETKNKAIVVFSKMSDSVIKHSEIANTTLGMSARQYLDYASTLGAALTAGGMGIQDATALSEQAVKHFADLASFHNSTAEDASMAWQSAVRGQYESIQKYFPFINNEYMKTYGVAQGLIDANTENLTANQRAIILNAIALNENLNPALNDFAETSEGLANQQRSVGAQLEDAGRILGTQLLPYVLQFVHWVSGLITKFQALSPEQQRWIILIGGALAVLGPLLIVVGSLVTAIGAIIPVITAVASVLAPFALPILAIIAVLALLYLAWTNNWFGIQEKTRAVIDFIKGIIASGMQFIQNLTSGKLGWLSQMWQNAMNSIRAIIESALAIWRHIKQAWRNIENGNWYMFGVEMRKIWDIAMRLLETLIRNAWENIKMVFENVIKKIIDYFKNIDWAQVGKNIIEGIINGLFWAAVKLDAAIRKIGQNVLNAIKGFFSIHSESKVFKYQVGWEMGAGTASGWEESINKLLLPKMGPGMVPEPIGAVAGMGAVRGGGGGQGVTVVLDYHPLISTADENEAKFVLAPMIQDEIRKRAKQG